MTRIATLTSATCSFIGSSSRPKNVVSAPNGTTAKAANAAVAEMIGASAKSKRVGRLRPQLLLEHQLDDVGERLQQALRPDAVRAEALLQERRDLPLDVHHHRRRGEQHGEDEERQDDAGRRGAGSSVRRPTGVPRAPLGRQRAAALADVRLVLVPEVLQRREHRRRGGVAERAERLAGDVAGDAGEQIEIAASRPRRARSSARILWSQSVPSRHGVHLPHDSWR